MANVTMYNMEGAKVGELALSDAIFGVEVKPHLIHKAVVWHLNNKRQGTQKAKGRSEVSGGGRKPWRQKGTGHARQGSIRAAQWKGGGVIFPPTPRDYGTKINKKEKRAALKSALSQKVLDENLIALEALTLDEIGTKEMAKILEALKAEQSTLIVLSDSDHNVVLSARNIPQVETIRADLLNTYDVMKYKNLVVTKDAAKRIEEVFA